jgi:hypothetical protein
LAVHCSAIVDTTRFSCITMAQNRTTPPGDSVACYVFRQKADLQSDVVV